MRIFKALFYSTLIAGSFITGLLFYIFTQVTIDFSALENYDPGSCSIVLDDTGNEFARFQLDRREPIPLDALSPSIIPAFLAAEDQHFFIHHGVSLQGIVRSFIANFSRRKIVQGASTITQQLIKLLFLDNRRTFERKIREFFLALLVEQQFSKEQILQTYLNHLYFGCGIYGIQAASKRFWNISSSALNPAQAAALAGIIQSPEKLCPLVSPEKCLKRRNIILKRMLNQKKISPTEYQQACAQPLALCQLGDTYGTPHIKEMIRQQVEALVGKKELYTGGLTIQTTVSSTLQHESTKIFKRHLALHQKNGSLLLDGGFLLLEGATGKIKALVGGDDFTRSQFNRVTQAKRQWGSIFKPLIYAVALKQGARMDDICIDEPVTIDCNGKLWSPKNYNNRFSGQMTRAYSLYKSINTVALQTLYTAGIEEVIKAAHACGITQDIPPYPSLALGCIDVTLLQASAMFNSFAHQGMLVKPYCIEWIKDIQGKKIYKATPIVTPVLDWYATSQVTAALAAGMAQLRKKEPVGSALHSLTHIPLIGKTGTTNDARNCYFIAATPTYTAAAYFGNDDNSPLGKNFFASQTVRPLVLDILKIINHPQGQKFMYHPDLKQTIIHELTGKPCVNLDEPAAIKILVP